MTLKRRDSLNETVEVDDWNRRSCHDACGSSRARPGASRAANAAGPTSGDRPASGDGAASDDRAATRDPAARDEAAFDAARDGTNGAEAARAVSSGGEIAFINIQAIAANSAAGKEASKRLADLNTKKAAEISEKNKQLQAAQTKLNTGGAVLSETARGQLEKDIDRMQRDIQFSSQNAQAEMNELTERVAGRSFSRNCCPAGEGHRRGEVAPGGVFGIQGLRRRRTGSGASTSPDESDQAPRR